MSQKYEKLKTLLKELFQLDQPDLDFGIYRVMHAKSIEVSQFLDEDLLPQVRTAFGQYRTADKVEIEKDLATAIEQAKGLGVDPETTQRVKDLRARLTSDAVDIDALESEVYDHLFSFFRRYYSEGDFLAKRVYKPGVYAIPYEGEEVTLHWANMDQYYIKTSEYLRDYAFRLRPGDENNPMRVHFRLADAAEGEHGNIKAAEGKNRVFVLAAPGDSGQDFITEEDGEQGKELVIRFEYRPATLTDWPEDERAGKKKPPVQKDLSALAAKRVLPVTDAALTEWIAELGKPHVMASGEQADYTRLAAHLRRYTARNTFDYFIHKNLGAFLRRELDFYIKNEIMHLDDVENEAAPRVEQYLAKIKVIRKIAGKIIDFLAQLEDFQKKLWLKRKFVIETQYCVSVGCIPEAFYEEIAANKAQHEEWVLLFAIDEIKGDLITPGYSKKLKPAFLKSHPALVVDTQHFDASFTERLLEAVGDMEEHTEGVLFHSENFQALSLMQARYRNRVKCIYIDPPYNTGNDGFSYKDNYQHSSWLSLASDRVAMLRRLLRGDGAFFGSIDDREVQSFRWILNAEFGQKAFVSAIAVINNWKGRQDREHIATVHEHLLLYAMPDFESLGLSLSPIQLADYDQEDDKGGKYQLRDLRKRGGADTRALRENLFFPIYWDSNTRTASLSQRSANDIEIVPVKSDGVDGCWRWKEDTVRENLEILEARIVSESKRWNVSYRIYLEQDGESRRAKPKSVWAGAKYSSDHAIKTLRSLMPNTAFKSPKAVGFVEDVISHSTCDDEIVVDVFAGSGTSAHATIAANRKDGGERRIISVEQSDDFDTVLLPRIKKVAFTPEWKDGKPKRLATPEEAERSPRIVKVVRLESYEDALDSLEAHRTDKQQLLLDTPEAKGADGLREQYTLRYMLDVETRGSQSLLNVQAFTDPTAYKLKVKRPGSDESREVDVDLLETFNWLIGLTVRHIAAPQAFSAAFERDSEKRLRLKGLLKQEADGRYWFRTVTGGTPDGRRTLVIWRKLSGEPEQDNLVLDEWFTRQGYSARDSEFDLIYVNGGNNLENLKTPDDLWKVAFAHKLVLNQWLLSLFNVERFEDLAEHLRNEALEGLDENNIHHFHHALTAQLFNLTRLPTELLLEYDQNIVRHTQRLNARRITRGEEPIVWKYFQYLTLLFSEIYLDCYFRDPKALLGDLNKQVAACNANKPEADRIATFDEATEAWPQLNKLAFWMATGSGKTLLMHANILQYRHALTRSGRRRELNRILLLTPNEGLSQQHLREFEAAGIDAELFNKDGRGLFSGQAVEIIEVTRLRDEMGDRTIAIDAFEGNNLVLVDEGHRGASGGEEGAWMRFRNALCEKGFSFEYSATFGQAIKGNPKLTELYAKSTLCDYSYRYFYGDGFGKDYQILNLDEGTQQNHLELYLVACLLSFFQQQLLYREHSGAFRPFNIENPLWIFVGGRVVKGLAAQDASDIVEILRFLARYVSNRAGSIQRIDRVLNQGLVTATGKNLFAGRFAYLNTRGLSPAQIFDETLATLFNAPGGGRLHVENLKGAVGEVALRLGAENEPFGVINVGDDAKLVKLCDENGLATGANEFSGSLFHEINQPHSTVHLLIGSKKFTEGWSSWRVSTMGLMNVGKGEGAQIIQLFGRGVRLKGYDLSLKRSARTKLPEGIERPKHIGVLETLGVFGIHADYMAQFRDFLEEEGLPANDDRIEFLLPVIKNLGIQKLKTIRLKKTINGVSTEFGDAFRKLAPVPTLAPPNPASDRSTEYLQENQVVLNWYPKIQAMKSSGLVDGDAYATPNETRLTPRHVAFLDLDRICFDLERFKAERGWYNLNLTRQGVEALLDDQSWYRLQIPAEELIGDSYEKVRLWEEIAVALLKKYTERYYTFRKSEWELPHLEYRDLEGDDPNFLGVKESPGEGYRILIDESQEEIVAKLEELKAAIEKGDLKPWEFRGMKAIWFGKHLYQPLLYLDTKIVEISPAPLNKGERQFVEDLKEFHDRHEQLFETHELYLLRNLSRGRGVGFFEAGNFHPDFILWLLAGGHQQVIFVDPKGIRNLGPGDPKIQFFETIKEIEQRLGHPNVRLHSFIVSNTPSATMCRQWGMEKSEMQKRHILFQEEDKDSYVDAMLKR